MHRFQAAHCIGQKLIRVEDSDMATTFIVFGSQFHNKTDRSFSKGRLFFFSFLVLESSLQ